MTKPQSEAAPMSDEALQIIADCRNAFPIPEHGSPLESAWMEAINDPANVPNYMRKIAAALAEPSPKPTAQEVLDHEYRKGFIDGQIWMREELAEPSPAYRLTPADLKVFLEEARTQLAEPSPVGGEPVAHPVAVMQTSGIVFYSEKDMKAIKPGTQFYLHPPRAQLASPSNPKEKP